MEPIDLARRFLAKARQDEALVRALAGNRALPMGWVCLTFSPNDDNHDDT